MSKRVAVLRGSLCVGLALIGLGCPTTYVTLGDDDASSGTTGGAAGAAGVAGMVGGYGSVGGTGGVGGSAGGAGIGIGGMGGFGGAGGTGGASGSCAPSEETLNSCAPYAGSERLIDYNGCLNQVGISMGDGVGGAPGALCAGYAPCSYQHEGCLYYQTSGAAGSNSGCAGAPGDAAWLEDCGGDGYYGEEIIGGTGGGGAGGAGGSGGSTGGAGAGAGGASGASGMGGVGGEPVGGESGAGTGGEAGS